MNHVMNEHLAIAQTVPERFDLICDAQGEIVVGEGSINARPRTKRFEEFGHFELGANVEIRVFVIAKELEEIPARPACNVEIGWHAGIVAATCGSEQQPLGIVSCRLSVVRRTAYVVNLLEVDAVTRLRLGIAGY